MCLFRRTRLVVLYKPLHTLASLWQRTQLSSLSILRSNGFAACALCIIATACGAFLCGVLGLCCFFQNRVWHTVLADCSCVTGSPICSSTLVSCSLPVHSRLLFSQPRSKPGTMSATCLLCSCFMVSHRLLLHISYPCSPGRSLPPLASVPQGNGECLHGHGFPEWIAG